RAADRGPVKGPLHGIPIGVKDIIDVAGMRTTCGSVIYSGNIATSDAACVAMARNAGAIILGKTVSTEFAAMTPGKTRNPHDLTRSPGGSSSGSAAALAYGSALLTLGTQTIGSTVRPAAYCGVVGFKPTYGLFSLEGVKAQAESMDTLGLLARSTEDIELFANSLLGVDNFAGNVGVEKPIRIGLCRTPQWPEVRPETVSALQRAATAFENAGAQLQTIDLEKNFTRVLDAQWLILKFEFARALAYEHANFRDQLSPALRGLLDDGRRVSLDDYYSAIALARTCREGITRYFKGVDLFLTPSAASEAPAFDAPSDLLFQRLWSVLRLPAITLPAITGPNGLPVGVQLVGKHGDDARLLALAGWAEKALPAWRPALSG
ncbi:MAG: amidase, partial [Halioglobus sp.]|nr:amidase [Halioglobus sp.]